jgi:dihydrofolate reductase
MRPLRYSINVTLDRVDWNAELVRGDLGNAVQQLKGEPGKGLFVGGVKLPLALADLGLINEYEFVVQPILAGHGPTLFAGLSERLELRLVARQEFGSGAGGAALPARSSHGLKADDLARSFEQEADTGLMSSSTRTG